jgi:hypothetical protein
MEEPGAGCSVDPLGEGLMKLLPDGFSALFAPAAAPPAFIFGLLPGRVPGAVPVVVPPMDDPVVTPLVPDPAVPPAAEPVPVCAKAKVLVRAIAAASPMLVSFMMIFLFAVTT